MAKKMLAQLSPLVRRKAWLLAAVFLLATVESAA